MYTWNMSIHTFPLMRKDIVDITNAIYKDKDRDMNRMRIEGIILVRNSEGARTDIRL